MDKNCRMWMLVLVLEVAVGCAGESSNPPPMSGPAHQPVSKPAMNKEADAPKPDSKTTTAPEEAAPKSDAPSLEGPKTDAPKSGADTIKLASSEIAAIEKLPAADREQALKQAVCPASGEHLGAMGVPFKVSVQGRSFFLCCKGCQDDVKADPQGIIAKLDTK
jgi:hypothetical protein